MRDYQQQWRDTDVVQQFASKAPADFFRSERKFLDSIATSIDNVLDVGCAAGRFIELLKSYGVNPRYTGIDLSDVSLAPARGAYPDARFIQADALDFAFGETFSLVNATGVCQHEPRFEALIQRMVGWSSRYVLFDIKLARIAAHLADIERSYCGIHHRSYFIVLAPGTFLTFLRGLHSISRISIFGYVTPLNAHTVVPEGLGPIVSAGVLLEKGTTDTPQLTLELPDFLRE
jgi:SAM-dependent methyltransferase